MKKTLKGRPPALLSVSESPSERNQRPGQPAKSPNAIRKDLGKLLMGLRKVPPGTWNYLKHMFLNEKAAFWTMVFTGLLTYVTFRLVIITDKVDETARITQRAFMSAKGFQFVHAIVNPADINKTEAHRFIGTWENSGTTPTKIALAYANYKSMTDPIPDGFTYPDAGHAPITPVVIGPKQDVSIGPLDIPVADIQAKKHLYFWGWMEYYDIFENSPRHLTEFCYEVNFVGDPANLTDLKLPLLAYYVSDCAGHNCYDETCQDYTQHNRLKR